MTWRRSRYGDEWLGQTRAWFGPSDFPNEAEVGIDSATDDGPFNVSVQAEIYHPGQGESETFRAAEDAIRVIWPNLPESVAKAFHSRKEATIDGWKVEVFQHSDHGFTVGITGSLPAVRD